MHADKYDFVSPRVQFGNDMAVLTYQLNAYVGIDLIRYQSGQFLKKGHINKRGNPKARAILF